MPRPKSLRQRALRGLPQPLTRPDCPECSIEGVKHRLGFLHMTRTQWGSVITQYDYFRCRHGHGRFVTTNGREPQITTSR